MSTPHIRGEKGDVAKTVILPGDPLRAKYIAETFLEDAVQFTDVRGMLGFTGTYKGKPVSVMGTGMGMPSMTIYATELITYFGAENLIRVGTCGSLKEDIGLKDIVLAQGCCTDSALLSHNFPGDFAPIADFGLLNTAYELAQARGLKTHVGLLKTSDLFYFEDVPNADNWARYGVIGVEMESAALYTLAAKYGVRALTVCTVSDSAFTEEEVAPDERERALNDMITLALDTAAAL